ncbi:MAG: DMT family transporter [Firmicutes bacterium]|nr:DMT family transporter [Bacillota bacterium]MBR4023910.1 DMT family transporter [Bacillota bacterium]
MSKKMKANLLLFIAAFIWGTAFVAQKSGGAIGSFTFNGIRTFIGGLVLLPLVIKNHKDKSLPLFTKEELTGGIVCGFFLFVAASLQQFGLAYTTAGKAAFITTLYVVFCPILSLIVHKKKTRPLVWLCVVLDVIGLYLLCMTDASFSIQIGDTLVILCAVAFAGQMVAVDNFIDRIDGIKLSCIQFLFSGLLGIICMFIFEGPVSVSNIMTAWFPILYAGVISCGIAYTFQVLGQKEATPTIAALILCLESVFGVLAGAVILGETMTMREIFGCIIMFAAVVISNLPEKSNKEPVAVE